MMIRIHYTKPDAAQGFLWKRPCPMALASTGGSLTRHLCPQANIPASPPRDPEVPPEPESPIKPGIPNAPDELPNENPPEIEEPPPDVIPVPVSEPPWISGKAPVRPAAPRAEFLSTHLKSDNRFKQWRSIPVVVVRQSTSNLK
jgi:hypothetical protein